MTRASDLKKSDVIEANGTLYAIRQIEVQSPSARGGGDLVSGESQCGGRWTQVRRTLQGG